jgi:hypothetical protein
VQIFSHFLLTRFNVLLPGYTERDRAWLEHRFDLFARFCFPSVETQSCRNFRWLVFFDEALPYDFRIRVEDFQRSTLFHPIYVGGLFGQSTVQDAVLQFGLNSEHLITSRLDCDDAIATRYIETVQAGFCGQDFEFVNFKNGYVLSGANAYSLRYTSNPFISLIERTQGFQSVFCGNHTLLSKRGPIRQIEETPGWLQVVHDRNLRNHVRGNPVATEDWIPYFSIHPACLSPAAGKDPNSTQSSFGGHPFTSR